MDTRFTDITANARQASWNDQKEAIRVRGLIENTWKVRFRALSLTEQQADSLATRAPIDTNFSDLNDQYQMRRSTNSIFIHSFGAWLDMGYVMFLYQDNLYYVNVAPDVEMVTSLYNRTDTLSHLAKILIVLKDHIGKERKATLVLLEGELKHRSA